MKKRTEKILIVAVSVLLGLSMSNGWVVAHTGNDPASRFYIVPENFAAPVTGMDEELNRNTHEKRILELKRNARRFTDRVTGAIRCYPESDVKIEGVLWLIPCVIVETEKPVTLQAELPQDAVLVPSVKPESVGSVLLKQVSMNRDEDGAWGLASMGIPLLWKDGFTGRSRLFCIFDSGVDGNNAYLRDRWRGLEPGVSPSSAWLAGDGSEYPWDSDYLGTMAAGISVGCMPGDTIGVAPEAKWIAAKVLGESSVDLLEAFQWAADPDGDPSSFEDVPDVVNCSFRTGEECPEIIGEAILSLEWIGPAVIFAGGNEGPEPYTSVPPGNLVLSTESAWSVGAVDSTLTVADFSSRGPSPCDSLTIEPRIVAPGVDILGTVPGSTLKMFNGTGCSAAFISGLALLLRQAVPTLSSSQLKGALALSAEDLGPAGPDNNYGNGFVYGPAVLDLVTRGVGTVSGKVSDRATGQPLSDTYVDLLVNDIHAKTGQDGTFSFTAPAGMDTLKIDKLFYHTSVIPVTISSCDTVNKEIVISKLPTCSMTGIVKTDHEEGVFSEMDFSLFFRGEPVPCCTTYTDSSSGEYTAELIEGEYKIDLLPEIPFSKDEFTSVDVDSGVQNRFDAQVEIAEILLVDDDGGDEYEKYFFEPMDSLNLNYRTWDCGLLGSPARIIRERPTEIVIWMSGDREDGILTEEEDTVCDEYLVSGGKILITGQNILESMYGSGSSLVDSTLKLRYFGNTSEHFITGVEDDGLGSLIPLLATEGPEPPVNQNSEDIIGTKDGNAVVFLTYAGSGGAAVRWSGAKNNGDDRARAVWLGFGFEGVHDLAGAVDRKTFLGILLDWLREGSGVHGRDGARQGGLWGISSRMNVFPNPFNPDLSISFSLEKRADIRIDIFSMTGALIKHLLDGTLEQGVHTVNWLGLNEGGEPVASGVYIVSFSCDDGTKEEMRVVLLK